jgi:deoxyribose-phosphate aldolase
MKPIKPAVEMSAWELAKYIDHSVLKPEFSVDETTKIIKEGIAMGCMTVCVQGCNVDLALELTKGTETKVAPCVGFPQGVCDTAVKVFEAELYSKKGVFEIDMVANFGWIRSGLYDKVEAEIAAVVAVAHKYNVAVKVILETDTLTTEQIVEGTKCVMRANADFVKTSTGFITGVPSNGATEEVIRLMMDTVEGKIKVKGSAGIRTREHFLKLIDMGIDRMGIGYKSTALVLGFEEKSISTDAY